MKYVLKFLTSPASPDGNYYLGLLIKYKGFSFRVQIVIALNSQFIYAASQTNFYASGQLILVSMWCPVVLRGMCLGWMGSHSPRHWSSEHLTKEPLVLKVSSHSPIEVANPLDITCFSRPGPCQTGRRSPSLSTMLCRVLL